MNLFYKYSHLQRFEQQNEKDGRKEKGQMTNEKGQMRKEKGQIRKEKDYKMTKEKGRRKIKVCKRKKGRWEKEKEKTSRLE